MRDGHFTWGKCDRTSAQGWAYRQSDRRYWTASWSGTQGNLSRDGQMTYRQHAWRSENEVDAIYPKSVVDNFGALVPVPLS